MKTAFLVALVACLSGACSGNPPPDACNAASTASTCAEARPDRTQAVAHLKEHVSYPATRSEVLAACASTKEFSDAEKQWFIDHLPEGKYTSADDVVQALKL